MANGTKRKILHESMKLFKEKGYAAVSVEDICAAAGITRSTFYYHYKTKAAILDSVYVDYRSEKSEKQLASIFLSKNKWEQLWWICEDSIDLTQAIGWELESMLFTVNLTEHGNVFSPAESLDTDEVYIAVIEQGQQEGQFLSKADPVILGQMIRPLIVGTTLEWCDASGEFDLKKRIRERLIALLNVKSDLVK